MKLFTFSIVTLALLINVFTALAQNEEPVDHRIVMVKDLLQDADEAFWKDHANNRIL